MAWLVNIPEKKNPMWNEKINYFLKLYNNLYVLSIGGVEEEGYYPVHPDEVVESSEEEEEEDLDAHAHFGDVSEIRFPGEVGPLGDPRLCKIRCVKGKWVGPLCATNEEGKFIEYNCKVKAHTLFM